MPNLTPICAADTPEWLEMRKTGLGASDAPAIVGVSDWDTPFSVFLRKTGQLPEKVQTDAMIMGHLLEPVIWTRFEQLTRIPVRQRPVGLLRHPDHEWMLATPDAILEPDGEGLQVGESKSTNWRRAAELGETPDDVPADWIIQVQQQLAVTGLETGRLAVLLDGRTLLNFRIERNQNLIDALIEAEAEFWQRIQNNDPPPPDFTSKSTTTLIKELFGNVSEARVVDISDEAAAMWNQAQVLKTQVAEMEEEIQRLQAAARYEMGDAPIALLPGRTDVMLKRSYYPPARIEASTRSAYTKLQGVKYSARTVALMREQAKIEALELLLYGAGYHLKEASKAGSRYYCADGKVEVRVSDHEPNADVMRWIEESGAIDVRLDDAPEVLARKLASVL